MASYRYERDIDPKDLQPRKQRQYTPHAARGPRGGVKIKGGPPARPGEVRGCIKN